MERVFLYEYFLNALLFFILGHWLNGSKGVRCFIEGVRDGIVDRIVDRACIIMSLIVVSTVL